MTMTLDSERAAFEVWYVENAFNYEASPLGSRECSLQWKAWQASRSHLTQPAQAVDVLAAERDARTIYDIACIRESQPNASREDVDFKAIALRNYQFCAAVSELIEAIAQRKAMHADLSEQMEAPMNPTTEQERELLEHAKAASKAEAHLYAWAAVEAILESGATPGRQDDKARRQVERVLKICRDECHRLVGIHDKHLAAITQGAQGA